VGASWTTRRLGTAVITGVHAIVFAHDAERARAFFRDTLGFDSVDAGGGWLIFALPPAELAAHPTDERAHHELYLMCDDLHATVAGLKRKGVEFTSEIAKERWGLTTAFAIPGGGQMALYEPRHPRPNAPPG
jgi:catechol 2,3-dioxygenase-like lactoylglutathione lyase family enzyme